jgi:hypothetical protein
MSTQPTGGMGSTPILPPHVGADVKARLPHTSFHRERVFANVSAPPRGAYGTTPYSAHVTLPVQARQTMYSASPHTDLQNRLGRARERALQRPVLPIGLTKRVASALPPGIRQWGIGLADRLTPRRIEP